MDENDPRRWPMLATLLSATFMPGFDANAVNVALPSLHRELGAGSAALELVIGGYLFTYASFLITSGRLGDIFGHRRLFMTGMAGFAVTSLLCGLAQSPTQLVVARLLQGATAAAMVPLSIGRQKGWPVWAWACLIAAVPTLALALGWERRQAAPLVNLALFQRRSLGIGLLMYVAFMSFFVSMTFALSLLLQSGLGLSPLAGGLTFVPFALLAMVAAPLSEKITARLGQRALTVGALLSSLGMFGLGLEMVVLHGDITAAWMQLPLCVIGLGNGLMLPLFVGVTMSDVKPAEAGSASGLLTTTQQFSGALGLAVMGASSSRCWATTPAPTATPPPPRS
ncbi:MFS transporter [Frankia tisae]|uniref:MFS transporter n=1 Tax=Frankia tisae TaxID=2950104 RepID=UPI0021C22CBE|nr:MFS transporter [Frankia tisae]